jgi:type II secretory pathway pseudopilin PulG
MPVIIPAIIAGAGAIGGALISSNAVNNASNAATAAAAANNALQLQIYNSNKGLETPYIDRGDAAGNELNGFLGLGGDPAKIQQAFNTFLNSTGYQFNYNQGLDAALQNKAAAGMLDSGSATKALDAYGTGLADQYGQQYASDLAGVSSQGAGAANALAGEGENYANQVSSNNNNAATVQGNAAIAGANIDSGLINNALNAYALTRGSSSYGGGGGNAFNTPVGTFPVGG